MLAVLKKELNTYFGTSFGFIFMGIFLILSGIMFTIYNLLGRSASMAGMFDLLKNFTVIFFPVLVMKLFAEERERGTEQFLLTSKLKPWEIVMGKYLAACVIFAAALAATLIYAAVIARYGSLNVGAAIVSYLGFYLLGVSMIAVCLFVASFADSQISAAVLAFGILFLMVILLSFTKSLQIPVISQVLSALAITKRYDSFVLGALSPGPVLYYLGISAVCVALTIFNMEYRRFRHLLGSLVSALLLTAFVSLIVMTGYKSRARMDLTEQKMFTLSPISEEIAGSLKEPVKIAVVSETGREEPVVKALLKEYEKLSSRIEVSYIDPEKKPSLLARYDLGDVKAVYNGSLIVEGPLRTKILRNDSLFSYTSEGNYFYGEREVTGALRYVTAEELPMVYFVTGHGEVEAGTNLNEAAAGLSRQAYGVKSLVLLQQEIPEDAKILVIASPKEDVTDTELEKIKNFLANGGKLFLMVDPFMTSNEDVLQNLNALTHEYGIDISNNYVVEENSEYYLTDNETYLIPRYGSHEITAPIGELQKLAVLPLSRGLGTVECDERAVTREILLLTSDKSWARNDMRNAAANRTETDIKGPLAVGFAAQRSNAASGKPSSRLVVLGDSDYMTDGNYRMQANSLLFENCVNWLLGGRDSDLMSGKVMNSEKLLIRGTDFIRLTVICCAILPFICFAAAFLCWKIRRNS